MPKSFVKCLWIQEILLVLAESYKFLSLASEPLIIYIDHFDFPDLVQFSQISTDNPNTQTGRNHFVCQASKQNAHNVFFLIISLAVVITGQDNLFSLLLTEGQILTLKLYITF